MVCQNYTEKKKRCTAVRYYYFCLSYKESNVSCYILLANKMSKKLFVYTVLSLLVQSAIIIFL